MKRLISSVLLLAMFISLFAGCGNDAAPETTGAPTAATTQAADDGNLADAVAYVKTIYKQVTEITAADYERIGVVPMGTTQYEIEWSADVSEDLVKIVRNANGMVTIDVNEESEEEVPYVLTATLTDGTNVETLSWNHILPKAVGDDMSAIVDMAYALEDGQSLDFEATLTGTINAINTAWSDDYQNITVTILIEGLEDKPIMCYRLSGDGAKDLAPGDLITVTGTLKNYKGTIEFDAGCTLDEVQKGAGTVAAAPTDAGEIIAAAYDLEAGQSLPYSATLTGKIIRVDTQWSSKYQNITVTMLVEGYEDKPIMCYRLKGDGAEDLYVDDIITVNGMLKNYYGTIEFDAGCTLEDVVPGPRIPVTFPEQPKDILKIMQDAYKLEDGNYLPYNLWATGVVTEVNTPWSDRYGNITVTIEFPGAEGYPLKCFRMVGKQYGANTIEVGDTIEVHGSVTNYKGTIELDAGCWCYKVVKGEGGNNDNNDSQFAKDMAEAAKLEKGQVLDRESTITGIITSNPNESSRNPGTYSFWVKDADGNSVQCYYVPVVGGVPAKGDTVTVTGHLSAYNGQAQFYESNATATLPAPDGGDEDDDDSSTDPVAPKPTTPAEIVDAAYALEKGETLAEGPYTLTGKVTSVKTAYSESYKNVTVIIAVAGKEDKPIECFRLKGIGADLIDVGDTVTVSGNLKNYNGTIEFDSGCTLDSYVLAMTQAEIVDALYELEAGESLEGTYTLTGVISSVDTAYSQQYGNVTVTMIVAGKTDKPVQCFRLKGTGADLIAVGDTITVSGTLKNYNGTYEFNSGCKLDSYVPAEKDEDVFVKPTTAEAIVDAAYALEKGETLAEGPYTLTGTVTSVDTAYSEQYGNVTVTIAVAGKEDKPIMCFRLKGDDAATVAVGNTITVTGTLKNYNGTIEFDSGCTFVTVS